MEGEWADIQDGDGRRAAERGVTSVTLHNRVCGAAGGQDSAGSLNRQFNRPNENHLTRPSCPKRIGKEKWGNRPLHCTISASDLRSIHLWSDYLNAICLLAHLRGVRAGASEQPISALYILSKYHHHIHTVTHTHAHTGRVTENC